MLCFRSGRCVGIFLAAGALALSGGSLARADVPPSVLPAGAAAFVANSPLGVLPDQIETLGASQFPNIYGSLVVTDGGTHIDVYLTSLDSTATAAISALAAPGVISFDQTSHTRAELLATHAKVTQQVPSLAAQGIQIVSWFPGINGDGLEHIGVVNLTPAQSTVLDTAFGTNNVVLENLSPEQAPVATGRNNDTGPPWNSGDALTGKAEGCTSGAAITNGGVNYVITAAHCYVPGTKLYNAFAGRVGRYVGFEESRDVSYGGDDTALTSITPTPNVWTGVIGSPGLTPVTGDATNPVGDTVCNEGSASGEVCPVVKSSYYGCLNVSGYIGVTGGTRYECNLVSATEPNNGIGNQDGDSGGPVVRYVGGNLKDVGIVSASGGSKIGCKYNADVYPQCFPTVYYTAMDQILESEYTGATLITGS